MAALGGDTSSGRNDRIFLAAPLRADLLALVPALAALVKEEESVFWAPASKAVLGRRRRTIGEVVLSEAPLESLTDDIALPMLYEKMREMGLERLQWGKGVDAWREKVVWVQRNAPGALEGAPDMTYEGLAESLEEWLGPYVAGARSIQYINKTVDLSAALRESRAWV